MTLNAVLKSPAFFAVLNIPGVPNSAAPKSPAGAEVGRQGWGDELSGRGCHGVGKPLALSW